MNSAGSNYPGQYPGGASLPLDHPLLSNYDANLEVVPKMIIRLTRVKSACFVCVGIRP